MKVSPNGLGESLGGDPLLGQKPFWVGGNVWWVNSVTGTDASGTAGQDQQKPLATLGQAVTNSAAGDVIVLQSGHVETLTSALTISSARTIVGVGTTSGKPGAQLKLNSANASLLTLSGAGCQLRNIYFPGNVQSNGGASGKVAIPATANILIYGCYFECGATDQQDAVQATASSNSLRVENCTFVSTATSTATRATNGLKLAGAITDVIVVNNTFDDGTVGFAGKAADLSGGTITRLHAYGNSLLRGADFVINSASTGFFGTGTLSGGSVVSW